MFRGAIGGILIGLTLLAQSAKAVSYQLDTRVSGENVLGQVVVDLPIIVREVVSGGEPSYFENSSLSRIYSTIETTHERIISFTPSAFFTSVNVFIRPDSHSLSFNFYADPASPFPLNNANITGVSEMQIGVLRVEVGPPITIDDGIGESDGFILLDITFSNDPSGSHNLIRTIPGTTGGFQSLNGLVEFRRIVTIDNLGLEPEAELGVRNRISTRGRSTSVRGEIQNYDRSAVTVLAKIKGVKGSQKVKVKANGKFKVHFKGLQPGKNRVQVFVKIKGAKNQRFNLVIIRKS